MFFVRLFIGGGGGGDGCWGMGDGALFFVCVINHGMAAGSCLGGSGCDFASMTLLVGRLFLCMPFRTDCGVCILWDGISRIRYAIEINMKLL